MEWTDALGLLAGVCTTVSVVPQIIKAFKTKKVKDVSPGMFVVLIVGVALWVIYGVLKNDFPIIATNGLSFLLNSFMMYLMIKYKKKAKSE